MRGDKLSFKEYAWRQTIGVTCTNDLKPATQWRNAANKARSVLGMILKRISIWSRKFGVLRKYRDLLPKYSDR